MKGTALDRVANEYVRKDPLQAAEWVKQYAEQEWMRRDPAAAGQWVEGAELPESVVTDIKRPRDERRWRR